MNELIQGDGDQSASRYTSADVWIDAAVWLCAVSVHVDGLSPRVSAAKQWSRTSETVSTEERQLETSQW